MPQANTSLKKVQLLTNDINLTVEPFCYDQKPHSEKVCYTPEYSDGREQKQNIILEFTLTFLHQFDIFLAAFFSYLVIFASQRVNKQLYS